MIKQGLKNIIETSDGGEVALTGYDYHAYTMTLRDRLLAFVIGAAGAAVVMHIFFGNVFVDLLAMIVTGIAAQKIYRKIMVERIKNKLTIQFKDMLDSVTSSISAGKVAQAAFMDAEKDMRLQYGEDSYIFKELRKINIGLCNNLTIETLLSDFGGRSGVEDIESFANVFVIANRQGGNIKTILTETKSILCDKIEIEQEIKTMLGATKNQLNIMMIMPLLIVPMSAGFTEGAENSLSNIMVKVGALVAFVIAYIIGRKITSIKM